MSPADRKYNIYHESSFEWKGANAGQVVQIFLLLLSTGLFGVGFGTFLEAQTNSAHAWSIIVNYLLVWITVLVAGIFPIYLTKLHVEIEDRGRHQIAFLPWFWLSYHHAALLWRAFILFGIGMPKALIYSTALLVFLHLLLYFLVSSTRCTPRFFVVLVGLIDYTLHGSLIALYIVYYQPYFWMGILAELFHVLSVVIFHLMSYGFIPVKKNAYHYLGLINVPSFLFAGLLAGALLG